MYLWRWKKAKKTHKISNIMNAFVESVMEYMSV